MRTIPSLRSVAALVAACATSTVACSAGTGSSSGEGPAVSQEQGVVCSSYGAGFVGGGKGGGGSCGGGSGSGSGGGGGSGGVTACGTEYNYCCADSTGSTLDGYCGPGLSCQGGTCQASNACNGIQLTDGCYTCPQLTNSSVAATANSSTQATVTFDSAADFTTDVWLVNANDATDQHQAWGPYATSSSVVVGGLRPSSTYAVVLLPDGATCGTPPTTQKMAGVPFGQTLLGVARSMSGLDQSNIDFSNGNLVLEASKTLATRMPSLANPPPTFPLPTKTFSPGGIFPDYTATFTSFSISGTPQAGMGNVSLAQATMNPTNVEFLLPFTATMHLHTGNVLFPDADLNIDSGSTIDVKVDWKTQGAFSVEPAVTNIANHVSNCGIFDFCNSIFQSQLPDLDKLFGDAVTGMLAKMLADPSVVPAFYSVLDAFAPAATPPWAVVPGTVGYNGGFFYSIERTSNASATVTTPAQ